jgi:2,4-dienoyl-CoA reductase-like NADH-dependent reductase (Old Yellow Enzyme family)
MLFSPWQIDGIQMPNRLVRSATAEGAAEPNVGRPTPAMVEFYKRLAAGGVGLIISGHVAVTREGRCSRTMTALYDDAFVPAFAEMVTACHAQGTPIVCQLNHGGRQVSLTHEGIRPVCPSAVQVNPDKPAPAELSDAEIRQIVADFGSAAGRAKAAGFDGVQIHSAHGYLVSAFNSPLTNRRTDRWGGSAEKRRTFLREVYSAMREAVGADYPVLVKQNVADFHPDGLTAPEAVEICAMLDELGVAAIELSGGIAETIPVAFRAKELRQTGETVFFADECRAIRERARCPLILTGGIRTKATAEGLLAEGICDGIGLCRPFIREPDLPRKWQEGVSDRAACISCGGCKQNPERCNYCVLDQ